MNSKELTNRIYDVLAEHKEVTIENEGFSYNVGISTNSNICNINISAPAGDPIKAKQYIEVLRNTQNQAYRYSYNNGNLVCDFSVWIDCKISKSNLAQLISVVTANFSSILYLMEQEDYA